MKHGSAFFHRDEKHTAWNRRCQREDKPREEPKKREKRWGGVVGGGVMLDRLHYQMVYRWRSLLKLTSSNQEVKAMIAPRQAE